MTDNFKFGRDYKLTIEISDNEFIFIKPPFTIEFNCTRHNLATANTGNFKIYNLAEKNRRLIYKDLYDITNYRLLQFSAGYDDEAPIIFRGNIRHAFSYRQGVNIVTEIEAFDGDFAKINGFTSKTLEAGQNVLDTLKLLITDLPRIQGSIVGTFEQFSKRAKVLFGNTAELLRSESEDKFYIDNEKAFVINDDEVIEGDISLITSETGLLESPKRSETVLVAQILFEPRIKVGQILELESVINSYFNGTYKVIGIKHAGIISEAVNGKCISTVSLYVGTKLFRLIQG